MFLQKGRNNLQQLVYRLLPFPRRQTSYSPQKLLVHTSDQSLTADLMPLSGDKWMVNYSYKIRIDLIMEAFYAAILIMKIAPFLLEDPPPPRPGLLQKLARLRFDMLIQWVRSLGLAAIIVFVVFWGVVELPELLVGLLAAVLAFAMPEDIRAPHDRGVLAIFVLIGATWISHLWFERTSVKAQAYDEIIQQWHDGDHHAAIERIVLETSVRFKPK